MAAVACMVSASAQTVYNYFDAADVDANGWLWFDTQAKIDKYVGWGNKYKIQLQSATYEDADGQYPEPYGDPTAIGWNAAGEQGEGAKTGAIILPEGSVFTNGSTNPNGGAILFQLPDCAEIDMYLSTNAAPICLGLSGGKGTLETIDLATIYVYSKFGFVNNVLANATQYEWKNVQDVINENTLLKLASPEGEKVTGMIRNNMKRPLYVQGIKILTYTNAANQEDAGIDGVIADGALALTVDGNNVSASEDAMFEVYSIAGVRVATANGTSVALDDLATGVYVVKATSDNGTATVKVIR